MDGQQVPLGKHAEEVKQGFTPLIDSAPETPDYGTGDDAVRTAAFVESLNRPIPPEPESPPVEYQDRATGEKLEGKIAVTAEKAAKDLSEYHRKQAQQAEADADLNLAIGALEAGARFPGELEAPTDQAPVNPPNGQPSEQPNEQRQEQATQSGLPPHVAAALQYPEVQQAIAAEIEPARQARAAYEQAIGEMREIAAASLFSVIPELNGVPAAQLPGALAVLQARDPQRHAFAMQQLAVVDAAHQRSQAIRQHAAQAEQQRFETWADEQDKLFEKKFPVFADPEKAQAERAHVLGYLRSIGIPDDAIPNLWRTELFRDAMAQQIIYDAATLHVMKEKAKNAVPTRPHPPQRPGTWTGHSTDDGEPVSRALSRLKGSKGEQALQAGVRLLRAQRQARG